jgi:O-succinylbenzoate synthase
LESEFFPLQIERVDLHHVRVPLREPFRISSGEVVEKDAIVVRAFSEGLVGLGESSPMAGGFYSDDTPDASWRELGDVIVPAVLNFNAERKEDWTRLLESLPAGNFTKAGMETAFADLEAKRRGLPLYRALGGVRSEIESGLAVGLHDDVSETLRLVERYLSAGYRRVKLKIEPGRDLEIVKAFRRSFGDIPLFVDANAAYSLKDAETFRRLDAFGLMMFEQPLGRDALEDSAELQRQVSTPVCLDESLHSAQQLQRAIALGSFRIANFKIQRVGGLAPALEMYSICRQHGIPAWVGTMPELGVGQAQGAALATLEGFVFPTDVEASDRWYRDDIIEPWIEVRKGMIRLPETPGLGFDLDLAKVKRYSVRSRSFPE